MLENCGRRLDDHVANRKKIPNQWPTRRRSACGENDNDVTDAKILARLVPFLSRLDWRLRRFFSILCCQNDWIRFCLTCWSSGASRLLFCRPDQEMDIIEPMVTANAVSRGKNSYCRVSELHRNWLIILKRLRRCNWHMTPNLRPLHKAKHERSEHTKRTNRRWCPPRQKSRILQGRCREHARSPSASLSSQIFMYVMLEQNQ